MSKEFIICSAIWINDQKVHDGQPDNIDIGFVVCGRRHSNCYQTVKDLVGDVEAYFNTLNLSTEDYRRQQGFMTSLDRYVDRREGWKIALQNGQVQYGKDASDNGDESILISENLY